MSKRILINADDLGLAETVNDAVVELAQLGRINATSYMANGRIGTKDKETLRASGILIGLHWDVTSDLGNHKAQPLQKVIALSALHANGDQAKRTLREQLLAFERTWGQAPSFIDGHQHVHQLPTFRNALELVWAELYPDVPLRLRSTKPVDNARDRKQKIIHALGGGALDRRFRSQRLNDTFGGVYDFKASPERLRSLWEQWLTQAPFHGHLIMCHPSNGLIIGDAIAAARDHEYQWLRSNAFGDMLARHQVDLTPL